MPTIKQKMDAKAYEALENDLTVYEKLPTVEELMKDNESLRLANNDLLIEKGELDRQIKRVDAMLGKYMDKFQDADAKNVWYAIEVAELKAQVAALQKSIQQLETGTEAPTE